jgi:hypothetical protein
MLSCLRPSLKKRKREHDLEVAVPSANGAEPTSDGGGRGGCVPGKRPRKRVAFGDASAPLERTVGVADADVDRTPIELPYTCDGCGNYILTTRMSCGGCEDFDLCEPCFRAFERAVDGDANDASGRAADEISSAVTHAHPPGCFTVEDVVPVEGESEKVDDGVNVAEDTDAVGDGGDVDGDGDAATAS